MSQRHAAHPLLCDDAVQEMVYYQTIDDDDEDLLAAILAASDAAPKYNPELLKGTVTSAGQAEACSAQDTTYPCFGQGFRLSLRPSQLNARQKQRNLDKEGAWVCVHVCGMEKAYCF